MHRNSSSASFGYNFRIVMGCFESDLHCGLPLRCNSNVVCSRFVSRLCCCLLLRSDRRAMSRDVVSCIRRSSARSCLRRRNSCCFVETPRCRTPLGCSGDVSNHRIVGSASRRAALRCTRDAGLRCI